MLLTCPDCGSGLEVPDGTTALVRCPACKTVFAPADDPAPEPEDDEDEDREEPRARTRKSARVDDGDEDDRPRKRASANRDFDPLTEEDERERKKRRRRSGTHETLATHEKAARRRAFERAAWGCRLIWISFVLFMLSMVLIIIFFFQLALLRFISPSMMYITLAGILGLINWILAAVGIGLCLSGPRAPGHWQYGIAAAVATVIHLVLVLTLVSQGKEVGLLAAESTDVSRWELLPTRLDATMFYLTMAVYQEQGFTPKGQFVVSMFTGVVEMVRTVLIMMMLSCLARAALDEELAHKCTRTAGVAAGGPGLIALIMFLVVASLIETNAGVNLFTLVLIVAVKMGIYAILIGVLFPAFMAAREVDDACVEPFQSLIPRL